MIGARGGRSGDRLVVLALVALKGVVGAWILHLGFTHVSDDDYARLVIAELFAHAPKVDPSGTSWLPFPFWLTGGAMAIAGRSLAVARGVAVVLGAASVVPVYLALRGLGLQRSHAGLSVALGMIVPWNAWLGVATVPEALTGALVAVGILGLGVRQHRAWIAAALLVAALSRYEAWPVCAAFGLVSFVRGARGDREELFAGALAVAGPLLWMVWNAHAHGSATHFVTRVVNYRHAIGAAQAPIADKLLGYPRALVAASHGLLGLAAAGLAGLVDPRFRRRWALPTAGALLLFAFLVYGDLRDGAPTHHPERAVLALVWVGTAFGVDGVRAAATRFAWGRPKREMLVVGLSVGGAIAWGAGVMDAWRDFPGRGASEDRSAQLARGHALKAAGVERFEVVPCAYEHFALLAAYGAPERVTTTKGLTRPVTERCPDVRLP